MSEGNSVGDVGGRSGLLLAIVTGEGGDAALDLAITGTLVGTALGRGKGFLGADVGLTAERGVGGAELG